MNQEFLKQQYSFSGWQAQTMGLTSRKSWVIFLAAANTGPVCVLPDGSATGKSKNIPLTNFDFDNFQHKIATICNKEKQVMSFCILFLCHLEKG